MRPSYRHRVVAAVGMASFLLHVVGTPAREPAAVAREGPAAGRPIRRPAEPMQRSARSPTADPAVVAAAARESDPHHQVRHAVAQQAQASLAAYSVPAASAAAASRTGGLRGPLTLNALEAMALENNPTLAQARAAVQAAYGQYVQAGLYPNPSGGYTASEIGNDGRSGQQGAFLGQEIVVARKLQWSQHAAAHEVERAEQLLEAQRYRVLTAVRINFYEALTAQRTVKLAEELAKISEEAVEAARAMLHAQQAARPDLLQARIEANRARILLTAAQAQQRAAWQRLTAVVGMPDMPPTPLEGELVPEIQELEVGQVRERLLAASPELQAAERAVLRARAALERARREPIPNLQTQAGIAYDVASDYSIASVQVGVSLPIFDRNQGNIQSAEAELVAAQWEVERIRLDLQSRLAPVLQAYATASAQVRRYSEQILPDAKETLRLITEGYRQGEFGYLNLLTAQRTYFEANLAYLQALRDWWTARLQIDGFLLSDGLARPEGLPN